MKKLVRPISLLPNPRFVIVLLLLLLILAVAPLLQMTSRPTVARALALFGLVVPLIAVAAAGDTGRHRNVASALALLTVLTSADGLLRVTGLPPQVGVVMSTMFLAYATFRRIAGVLRSPRVTGDVLAAGTVSGYIMLGLTGAPPTASWRPSGPARSTAWRRGKRCPTSRRCSTSAAPPSSPSGSATSPPPRRWRGC